MKRYLTAGLVAVATVLASTSVASAQTPSGGTTLYGLTTNNRIVTFSPASPLFASRTVAVTGLLGGEQLIGIDRRPKTGDLYAVGKFGTGGRLYTVSPTTGAATFVAALVTAPTAANPGGAPIVLSGSEFGFDFNPVADALRIVSDTGQNLRVIPSDRTPAGGLSLRTGDTFVDGALNAGGAPATGVSAAAYTNSVATPASTTLYDIDTLRDVLVTQNPPNAGTLVTVGSLRFPAGLVTGFDIVTSGAVNTGYATLSLAGAPYTFLAEIDLATGRASVLGVATFPFSLRGLAA